MRIYMRINITYSATQNENGEAYIIALEIIQQDSKEDEEHNFKAAGKCDTVLTLCTCPA